MRRRYQEGGLAALGEDDDETDLADPDADEAEQPGGAVSASGGIPALDIPGAADAFRLMQKSSADARKALQDARAAIMARQYSKADALLAASAALGAPTRSGSTAESFGAMAGALRGPLAAQRAFDIEKQKDLLGVNTQLAGLDEREAAARLGLAKLNAQLASKEASAGNDRVVGPDGKLHYMSHAGARQPGVVAWAPPGTQITNDMRQETEEDKAIGKGMGEQYLKLQQAGLDAPHQIAKYDRLANLLEGIKTNRLAPTFANISSIAEGFGIKLDPKLGPKQAAEALTNEIALTLRNPAGGAGMPGALSDADREYLRSMTPGLGKNPEANKLIIETATALARRDQEVAKLARDYRRKNGKLDEGFYDAIEDYANAHPLFAKTKSDAKADAAPGKIPPLLQRPEAQAATAEAETEDADTAPAGWPAAAEQKLRANPTPEMKRFFIEKYGTLPDGVPL